MDWSKSQSPELAAAWLAAIIESADDAIITVAGCVGWPANRLIVNQAERTLFLTPPPGAYMSADGQRLYVRGSEMLEFRRTSP